MAREGTQMTDVAEENPRIHKELDSDPNKKFDAPGAPGVLRRIGDRIGTVVGAESGVEGSSLTALQVQEFRELARQCTSTEPEIAEELSTALGVAHRIRT